MSPPPKSLGIAFLLIALTGCDSDGSAVTYVCEEPLARYISLAQENIENDYEVERSRKILENCPQRGYHRRYTFELPRRALVARADADARVTASWCSYPAVKTIRARASASPTTLRFEFTYPWSTATGKYPRTEFQINRNRLRGGFFEDLAWTCELKADPGA